MNLIPIPLQGPIPIDGPILYNCETADGKRMDRAVYIDPEEIAAIEPYGDGKCIVRFRVNSQAVILPFSESEVHVHLSVMIAARKK